MYDDMGNMLRVFISIILIAIIIAFGIGTFGIAKGVLEEGTNELEETLDEMEEQAAGPAGIIFEQDEETGEWSASIVDTPNTEVSDKNKYEDDVNSNNVAFGNQNNVVVENGDSIIVDEKVDYSKAIIVACIVIGIVVVMALFKEHKKDKMEHELRIMRHNEKVLSMNIGTYNEAEIQKLKDKYKGEDDANEEGSI